MSRKRRAAAGFLTGVVQLGVQLATVAALSPLVLHFAGQKVLGAYGVLTQAISYLWLLDFGFGVALARYLSQAFASREEPARFRRVAATGLAFYMASNALVALGAVALAVGAGGVLPVDEELLPATRLSLGLVALWAVIRPPLTIYAAALIAAQDLAAPNIALTIAAIVRLGLSAAALASGAGLTGLVGAQLAAEAVAGVVQWRRYVALFGDQAIRVRDASLGMFREMFSFGGQYLLAAVATRLAYSTDQLIVARISGLSAAAVYYTTQVPAFVLIQIIWKLADNALPAFNELFARKEHALGAANLLRVSKYSIVLALGAALGILAFNRAVVTMWVGEEQYAGPLMTAALAVFAVFAVINHLLSLTLIVHGRVWPMSVAGFVLGLANVGLSFPLGRRLGPAGVMVASALADVAGSVWFVPYVLRLVGIRASTAIRSALTPAVAAASFVVPLLVGVALIGTQGFALHALPVMAMFVIVWAGGIWLVGLDDTERREFAAMLNKYRLPRSGTR